MNQEYIISIHVFTFSVTRKLPYNSIDVLHNKS